MPAPDARLAYPTAMRHYARAIAYAQQRNRTGFDREVAAMEKIRGSAAMQAMIDQGVPAADLVMLAEQVARGRFAFARGRYDDAITFYRQAIEIEGRLPYQEPTYWYYPVKQSLGAALFQVKRYGEASEAFRGALETVPIVIETESLPGVDRGLATGVPGGIPGGLPGGAPGGIPGGIPDGVPGGVVDRLSVRDEPLRPGIGNVTMPELIESSKVVPVYPEIARVSRVEGRVILQAVIHEDGTVAELEVLRVSPDNFGFAESAVDAVEQWRYKPALQNGTPVDVYMTVVVEFRLK